MMEIRQAVMDDSQIDLEWRHTTHELEETQLTTMYERTILLQTQFLGHIVNMRSDGLLGWQLLSAQSS